MIVFSMFFFPIHYLELFTYTSDSVKFKSGYSSSNTPTNSEAVTKEKPSKKSRKRDKDLAGSSLVDPRTKEKLLVLPCGPSALGIMLLIILSGLYVVRELFLLETTF